MKINPKLCQKLGLLASWKVIAYLCDFYYIGIVWYYWFFANIFKKKLEFRYNDGNNYYYRVNKLERG